MLAILSLVTATGAVAGYVAGERGGRLLFGFLGLLLDEQAQSTYASLSAWLGAVVVGGLALGLAVLAIEVRSLRRIRQDSRLTADDKLSEFLLAEEARTGERGRISKVDSRITKE